MRGCCNASGRVTDGKSGGPGDFSSSAESIDRGLLRLARGRGSSYPEFPWGWKLSGHASDGPASGADRASDAGRVSGVRASSAS